jgi:riboflavin kinase/FMN adenylyltransferase
MQIWRSIEEYRKSPLPSPWVAMGVFDGVHRGHLSLLRELANNARSSGGSPIALTFDVHPESFAEGKEPPSLLSYNEEKLARLSAFGLSGILVLGFSESTRDIEPEEFVQEHLVEGMNIAGILAGYDTHFGRNRAGDIVLLKKMGRELGFEANTAKPLEYIGQVISSTLIRETLRAGHVARATEYLGYHYELTGTVTAGKGIGGSALGYPTANLTVRPKLVPGFGVYAAFVRIIGEGEPPQSYPAFLNIGIRPTFDDGLGPSIEVHLFNFNGDLIEEELRVEFVERLRDERKFEGPDELREQLEKDAKRAQVTLRSAQPNKYLVY